MDVTRRGFVGGATALGLLALPRSEAAVSSKTKKDVRLSNESNPLKSALEVPPVPYVLEYYYLLDDYDNNICFTKNTSYNISLEDANLYREILWSEDKIIFQDDQSQIIAFSDAQHPRGIRIIRPNTSRTVDKPKVLSGIMFSVDNSCQKLFIFASLRKIVESENFEVISKASNFVFGRWKETSFDEPEYMKYRVYFV